MFNNEEDYMDSLKQDDNYHFSIPFEYIVKNYGNDQYDLATTYMEVDVDWSDTDHGYIISYYAPEENLIDPLEGNGDVAEIYENIIWKQVMEELGFRGITAEAIVL